VCSCRGLTLRCTRSATAGFARFRTRVNSNVRPHVMSCQMLARSVAVALVCSLLASCGGGGGGGDAPPPGASVFILRMRGLPASEEFRITTSSAQVIAQARGELVLPEAQRRLFASGAVRAGNGAHNTGWSWHFENVSLVEAAIELCDGRPSMVEANLDYWLITVGRFCPWGSYVYAEVE
jgi:hypothetical protein